MLGRGRAGAGVRTFGAFERARENVRACATHTLIKLIGLRGAACWYARAITFNMAGGGGSI